MTPATCSKCGKELPGSLADAGDEYYCACPENDPYARFDRQMRDIERRRHALQRPIQPRNPAVGMAVRFALVTGEFHRTLAERSKQP